MGSGHIIIPDCSNRSTTILEMDKDETYNESSFYGESIAQNRHGRQILPSGIVSASVSVGKFDGVENNDELDIKNSSFGLLEEDHVDERHIEEQEYMLLVRALEEECSREEAHEEMREWCYFGLVKDG